MVANMINMGERIQWGRETTLMDRSADMLETHHQELQKAREETIEKHFTKIGMVHINAFCKLLKSHHSKGNDVMYAVRRTEQYPFIFETKADVAKEVEKYIQSELDQPTDTQHALRGIIG